MIIICEECGKKYRIDPAKIKGQTAKFRCKACNQIITVSKPVATPPTPAPPPFVEPDVEAAEHSQATVASQAAAPPYKPKPRVSFALKPQRVGVRARMMLLFFVLPIIFVALAGLLFLNEMNNLSSLITKESSKIVSRMAEDKIAGIARSVAVQCQLYLMSHPGLRKENYLRDNNFKRLAVQKVGLKGYTALYERPGSDGVWRTWAHVNPKIIGINMMDLKKALGRNFRGFWRVYIGVKNGKESRGYYTWQDKDGTFRDKFMVCTPIEGTPYVIAATTYIDEFTAPMNKLESTSMQLTRQTRNTVWSILGVTLLLIGLIVSYYGHRLAGRIKKLTEVADRISVGELDAEINITSRDEIGDLAEAIARMQDSVRLSIDRLRRRR
ncbi:MAG: HAMP domain-containing protein [Desulfobacterales bacterium]|jgi:predicted Zn finger-like uncharacterized protein